MKYICGFDFIEDDDDKNGDDVVWRKVNKEGQ